MLRTRWRRWARTAAREAGAATTVLAVIGALAGVRANTVELVQAKAVEGPLEASGIVTVMPSEPPTLIVFGAGVAALVVIHLYRRRRRRARSAAP